MNGRAGKCLRNIEKHYYVWVTGIIQYLNGLSHETEIWVNVMLLDRSILVEEPLVVLKIFKCFFHF
jgi:hypothetical protein